MDTNTKQTDGHYLEKSVVTFKFRPSYESQSDVQTPHPKVHLGGCFILWVRPPVGGLRDPAVLGSGPIHLRGL